MLADRFGARLTFGVFGSLFAAATVLTGLISGFAPLLAVRALVGLGEGPSLAVATRAIADWLPASQWSFAQGLTHAFSRVANAATAPMVAGLIVLSGWRGAFVTVGAITILWVALWVWYYRDDPKDHAGITPAELSVLAPSSRKRMPSGFYLRLLRRMAPVVATDFCYGWTLFVVLNWLPSFFRGAFHFDLSLSTAFTAGTFVAGIGGDILGGVISASLLRRTGDLRIARRNLIAAALFASAPLWSVPMDITPEHAGAASGMMNFGAALAGIASPWAFGWIVDRTGDWNLPFAATVALMLAGSGLAFLMRPERRFDAGAVP
jgi:MFS family permease